MTIATEQRFLSIPRDRRHLLGLIALFLGLAEFASVFFILSSFWESAAVISALFLTGVIWIRRGGIGGAILVGALCAFELLSFPTYGQTGILDWARTIPVAVISAGGVVVTLAVLKQSLGTSKAKPTAHSSSPDWQP